MEKYIMAFMNANKRGTKNKSGNEFWKGLGFAGFCCSVVVFYSIYFEIGIVIQKV